MATTYTLVTGNTYPVRQALKALGARWDSFNKGWQVPTDFAAQAQALVGTLPPKPEASSVGSFEGVSNLFRTAGAKLKYPKIRLQVDGQPVVLSVAGPKSSAPGSINVKGEGGWDAPYYGRVSPEGTFVPYAKLSPDFHAKLVPVLEQLAKDPVAAAREYKRLTGGLTGQCMFCGLRLDGEEGRSQAAGMGETCSIHWGLHEEWKNALKTAPEDVARLFAK